MGHVAAERLYDEVEAKRASGRERRAADVDVTDRGRAAEIGAEISEVAVDELAAEEVELNRLADVW